MIGTTLHEIKDLPTRERVEDGTRSIKLERVRGGWQITITHPETAIHSDGNTSKQSPEVYRCPDEATAWARYVAYAQALGGDVTLGKDGRSVVAIDPGPDEE